MKKQQTKIIFPGMAVGFILLAAVITYHVWANDTLPLTLDLTLQQAFINMRNDVLTPIVSIITHTTDTKTIVILCVALMLAPASRLKIGLPLTVAALANMGIYKAMKHILLRARPDKIYHLVEQGGYAFPSGHSATSMLVYGLLFYLIGRYCNNQKLKVILQAVCGILVVTVGPSRLYVGVHWATDVLAGWCIGATVLITTIFILERIRIKNESI